MGPELLTSPWGRWTFGPGSSMRAGAWWMAWNGPMPPRVPPAAWHGPAPGLAGRLRQAADARLDPQGMTCPALTGWGAAARLTVVLSLRFTDEGRRAHPVRSAGRSPNRRRGQACGRGP